MFHNQSDFQIVRGVLAHAFSMWSAGSNNVLLLSDLSSANRPLKRTVRPIPDIEVYFATGDHGDHEPFDGPGGIVAHSGYPMEGKVHFDAAELWTVGGKRGIDFRYVALHELGHALGLRHSQQNDSIMYPIYVRSADDLALSDDDINGIQHLYSKSLSKFGRIGFNEDTAASFSNATSRDSSTLPKHSTSRRRAGRRKRLKQHHHRRDIT